MAYVLAQGISEVGFRPGCVLFEIAVTPRGRVVEHAAILAEPEAGHSEDVLLVLDWPNSVETQHYADAVLGGQGRPLTIGGTGVVVGWIDPAECVQGPDLRILYTVARELLSGAIRNFRGGVVKDHYRVYPARERSYLIANDPDSGKVFRGSCVGFVEECFESAGVDLVVDQQGTLPEWQLADLAAIAPHIFPQFDSVPSERVLERILRFNRIPPPYRLFMPGYQMNALMLGVYPHLPSSVAEAFLVT